MLEFDGPRPGEEITWEPSVHKTRESHRVDFNGTKQIHHQLAIYILPLRHWETEQPSPIFIPLNIL